MKTHDDYCTGAHCPCKYLADMVEVSTKPDRESVLLEAAELITKDRNNQYGPPTQDFTRIAALWNALGFTFEDDPVEAHHVAMAIACLKLSRLTWDPRKRDSWVDLAGYAGCGYECVTTNYEAKDL